MEKKGSRSVCPLVLFCSGCSCAKEEKQQKIHVFQQGSKERWWTVWWPDAEWLDDDPLFLLLAQPSLVRFPNCHECQLGFQCPKKLEIGKQWPVVEKNYIATVIKLGKLTSSASQEKMSAKKNSPRFMVSRLEDQTFPPGNPHFGWRPFSLVGFVLLMKLYLRELIF